MNFFFEVKNSSVINKMRRDLFHFLRHHFTYQLAQSSRRFFVMKHYAPARPSVVADQPDKIRNIGIIAHIDAGKTTLTEQMLFLTGTIPIIGEVDEGSTVTDFMELERERGITIQSAAVSSYWHDHRMNLIDTPGHVDFTLEVERSLRVLDGTITVLDASAGVQAQTLAVWRQAIKFNLPSVFFINKMDKPNANFAYSLSSIEDRLNTKVLPLVVPFFSNHYEQQTDDLNGFIDVIARKYLNFERRPRHHQLLTKNRNIEWLDIQRNTHLDELCSSAYEDLCLRLADVDETFEKEIGQNSVSVERLREVIHNNTLKMRLAPVACGSALHSTDTVSPLLDMVMSFLPSPLERDYQISDEADICAFVFKVRHDQQQDGNQLNYVRIYRGQLQASHSTGQTNTALLNANTGEHQTNIQLFAPFSDLLQPIDAVSEGNIVVITGLENTKTGDTLVNCTHIHNRSTDVHHHMDFESLAPPTDDSGFRKNLHHLALEGVELPLPVFSCTIEPPNSATELNFRAALKKLTTEDPSIRIREDEETGQTILEGMGELHIEVLKERLLREYGMNAFFGPFRINYKEMPQKRAECSWKMENILTTDQWCEMRLEIEPIQKVAKGGHLLVERFDKIHIQLDTKNIEQRKVEKTMRLLKTHSDWIKAINEGCFVALHNGPILGFPIVNLHVVLREFNFNGDIRHLRPTLFSACASKCLSEGLNEADLQLLEPVMRLEVALTSNSSKSPNPEPIVRELTTRRANLNDVSMDSAKVIIIQATVPLAETLGLSKTLRSMYSGMASFHLQSGYYQPVDQAFVRMDEI